MFSCIPLLWLVETGIGVHHVFVKVDRDSGHFTNSTRFEIGWIIIKVVFWLLPFIVLWPIFFARNHWNNETPARALSHCIKYIPIREVKPGHFISKTFHSTMIYKITFYPCFFFHFKICARRTNAVSRAVEKYTLHILRHFILAHFIHRAVSIIVTLSQDVSL